jgi:hypothetical protein
MGESDNFPHMPADVLADLKTKMYGESDLPANKRPLMHLLLNDLNREYPDFTLKKSDGVRRVGFSITIKFF